MIRLASNDGRDQYNFLRKCLEAIRGIVNLDGELSPYQEREVIRSVLVPTINAGRTLSDFVLENKEVPARDTKRLEMATRAFLSIRANPRKFYSWVKRNERHIVFLLETERMPPKELGGETLFEVGPFRVHNAIRASGKELDIAVEALRKASDFIKRSRVPNANRLLYGDVYLVGRLLRQNTIAWYNLREDSISLRIRKGLDATALQSFLHEFGHRLWNRYLSDTTKRQWRRWHLRCGNSSSDMPLPKEGESLGFPVKNFGDNPTIVKVEGNMFFLNEDTYLTGRSIFDEYKRIYSYPTRYAATNFEEHFCEAFSLHCMGTLESKHESMFQRLIIREEGL